MRKQIYFNNPIGIRAWAYVLHQPDANDFTQIWIHDRVHGGCYMAQDRRGKNSWPKDILFLKENHGDIIKPISDVGFESAKIVRDVAFRIQFRYHYRREGPRNLLFLYHIPVFV